MTSVALVLAPSVAAHVFPFPTYVATDATTEVELSVPNERRVAMTGFTLQVPEGLAVADAVAAEGWTSASTPTRALWTDGDLPPFTTVTFAVRLDVDRDPGTVVLDAVERYRDGERVRWPMSLVVTPPDEASQQLGLALIAGVVGLLALTIGAAYLWRRTGRSLQER